MNHKRSKIGLGLASALVMQASAQTFQILQLEDPTPDPQPMDRTMLLAPRFGVTAGPLEEVASTGMTARKYEGDPVTGFADLYSGFFPIAELGPNMEGLKAGDIIELKYDIFLPADIDLGITGQDAQIRFYADTGEPGLQFGEGTDFANRV